MSITRVKNEEPVSLEAVAGCAVVTLIFLIVIGTAIIKTTMGFWPGYSVGERSGYVNKLSVKGFIFKTNEGEMQLGSGNLSSVQQPFAFSVRDAKIIQELSESQDKAARVTVEYRQWIIMPWRIGSSGYEIVGIKHPKQGATP